MHYAALPQGELRMQAVGGTPPPHGNAVVGEHAVKAWPVNCEPWTLKAHGRDVGMILIGEGLARSYHCGATRCPGRRSWCQ